VSVQTELLPSCPHSGGCISDKLRTHKEISLVDVIGTKVFSHGSRGFDLSLLMPEVTYVNIPPFLDVIGTKVFSHGSRGFDLSLLMPEVTYVNIPPFLGSREQLEHLELVQTCRIASLRIHVERAIERIKNYNITTLITTALAPLADHILFLFAHFSLFFNSLLYCLAINLRIKLL
jgi:hypothetical protein